MRAKADEIAGKHVDEYTAGMIEHDMHVGQLLDVLDELGIADNTIVHYSTDNGPHMNSWPDAAMTPFRGEKNTNWEGGWRVPSMVRWPGKIEAGSVSNDIMHHMDWLPTYVAAAGNPDIKEQLKAGGVQAIGREYKVHLDGYNFLPYLTGETDEAPRHEIFYFSDDGDLTALRYDDWKVIFLEHRYPQTLRAWAEPWTELRIPLLFNLRRDPYERSTSPPTPIGIGIWIACTYCCRHLPMCLISWQPLRSSRPVKNRAASQLAMPKKRSSARSAPSKVF